MKTDISDLTNYKFSFKFLYKCFNTKIMNHRELKLGFCQPRKQGNFRKNFGANGHLQISKVLIKKTVEYNKSLLMIFIDFQKTFDKIKLRTIISTLKEYKKN